MLLAQLGLFFWGESEHNQGAQPRGGGKSGAVALYETTTKNSTFSTLTPRERQALDAIVRLVATSVVGFDGQLLDSIRDILLGAVELDGLAIVIDDGATFWLQWRSFVGGASATPIAIGERREYPAGQARFADPPSKTALSIVLDSRQELDDLPRSAASLGVLSYVVLPIVSSEKAVGWLIVAHRVPGAPSQKSMALLVEVARVIGPAVVRAESSKSQQMLSAMLEESPDGLLALDPSGLVMEASERALRILGSARSEVVGKALSALVDEATLGKLLKILLREAPSDQPAVEIEFGGREVDVLMRRLSALPDGSVLLCMRDAGARKAAEKAVSGRLEEAAFLRSLGEAMAGAARAEDALARAVDICFVRFELGLLCGLRADEDDALHLVASHGASPEIVRKLSQATERELGEVFGSYVGFSALKGIYLKTPSSPADGPATVGDPWMMFVPLFHARRRMGALVVAGHPGDPFTQELSETWEPIANTIAVALRASGDFERVVALEAEKRQLVDNLPVIVARLHPQTGATLFVNAALHRVLGVPVRELGSAGVEGLLADALELEASRSARAVASGGIATGWQDRRYRHEDGRVLTLRESVYPVLSPTSGVHAVEIIAYDITTEIDARKQLMQSDRLASLGALAAGVAHEINNPVAFINLATGQMNRLIEQIWRRDEGSESAYERLREMATEVTEAAAHIAEIVGELKLFTRIPEGASACPVDINRMLQTAMTLTSAEVRRRARLDVSLGPLPLVPGAFASLVHVFANLLINAAQAIESKREAPPNGFDRKESSDVVRISSCVDGEAIVVRIVDTGVGIDEKKLPRIFDPFFKSRSGGHGAGLGLAIAYDMVRRVGGDILVTSSPGTGTSFDIVLPLEATTFAADVPADTQPRRPPTDEATSLPVSSLSPLRRVLIIDDELALVKALARQLSERYEVDTASTAADALAQLNVRAYDAVVCDLRLPERSGSAIYDEVVSQSPEQASRFIFTTGGSYGVLDDEPHTRAEATGLPVLEKPFDGASFEAAVERVASRPRTPT
jgi:PAS domain S-box-containing protein